MSHDITEQGHARSADFPWIDCGKKIKYNTLLSHSVLELPGKQHSQEVRGRDLHELVSDFFCVCILCTCLHLCMQHPWHSKLVQECKSPILLSSSDYATVDSERGKYAFWYLALGHVSRNINMASCIQCYSTYTWDTFHRIVICREENTILETREGEGAF